VNFGDKYYGSTKAENFLTIRIAISCFMKILHRGVSELPDVVSVSVSQSVIIQGDKQSIT